MVTQWNWMKHGKLQVNIPECPICLICSHLENKQWLERPDQNSNKFTCLFQRFSECIRCQSSWSTSHLLLQNLLQTAIASCISQTLLCHQAQVLSSPHWDRTVYGGNPNCQCAWGPVGLQSRSTCSLGLWRKKLKTWMFGGDLRTGKYKI